MALFTARDTIAKRPARKPVPAPTKAPYAREIMRWNGWVVFSQDDYYAEHNGAWFAVNEDTGENKDMDLTGYRGCEPGLQVFRDYIDLGFPTRYDVGPCPRTGIFASVNADDLARYAEKRAVAAE